MRSMQIENQFIFSTHFGSPIIECCHILIVTIHKIDLKAFDSHVGKITANVLHITIEGIITSPKNDTYIFGSCIIYQFFQINIFHYLHQIRLQVDCPTFIKDYIFYSVCRSEINIYFISRIIYSGDKINAIQVPVIPPIPCHFTGFDPWNIRQTGRSSQQIAQVACRQIFIGSGNNAHSPWKTSGFIYFGNVSFTLFHQHLKLIVSALHRLLGIRSELTRQPFFPFSSR